MPGRTAGDQDVSARRRVTSRLTDLATCVTDPATIHELAHVDGAILVQIDGVNPARRFSGGTSEPRCSSS